MSLHNKPAILQSIEFNRSIKFTNFKHIPRTPSPHDNILKNIKTSYSAFSSSLGTYFWKIYYDVISWISNDFKSFSFGKFIMRRTPSPHNNILNV